MVDWKRETINIAGINTELYRGGQGEPLLVLHGDGGNSGWLQYADALAQQYQVLLPSHPGFGATDRPDWLETMSDVVHYYSWFLRDMGLSQVSLLGCSLGGWIAAELASYCSHAIKRMVLVDPAGIKPMEGEIADIFLLSPEQVIEKLFHDKNQAPEYQQLYGEPPTPEQQDVISRNREMVVRLCWKPYMYNPRLPHWLEQVRVPSLIVWGRQDALIPLECGQLYQKALAGSTLKVIDNCGHVPHLENPTEFAQLVLDFLK